MRSRIQRRFYTSQKRRRYLINRNTDLFRKCLKSFIRNRRRHYRRRKYRSVEELNKELDNYHKEKEAKNESEKDVKMSEENK